MDSGEKYRKKEKEMETEKDRWVDG